MPPISPGPANGGTSGEAFGASAAQVANAPASNWLQLQLSECLQSAVILACPQPPEQAAPPGPPSARSGTEQGVRLAAQQGPHVLPAKQPSDADRTHGCHLRSHARSPAPPSRAVPLSGLVVRHPACSARPGQGALRTLGGRRDRGPQCSALMTKKEPRISPASFDFWRANLKREASSSGISMPCASLKPTARLASSSIPYITLIDRPDS